MRISRWLIGLALPVGLTAAWGTYHFGFDNPARAQASPAAAAGAKLPIRKIVLFSSGVGFFQREGEIDGDAKIDLTFPVGDVNDLLKSLTLQDLGGGRVQAVGYDSHDPIERTLKSFAINLAENPSQANILAQARGEKIEVTMNIGGPVITGAILSVEMQEIVTKEIGSKVYSLNLMTSEGMRSIKLADVSRVRFVNPTLEGELKRALETLSLSHDTQKKAVSLSFKGAGRRAVRVSYVVENPIWKTSYRLVLDKDGKPFLQGWAVVENPTDDDWSDVRMALVSGRPISFRMDLYSPLYAPRPTVEPELFASLRPPTYDGSMTNQPPPVATGGFKAPGQVNDFSPNRMIAGLNPAAPEARKELLARQSAEQLRAGRAKSGSFASALSEEDQKLNLAQGVTSAAKGAQLGDYFQYTLDDPITVARQKSALLPIVNREVEGSRVSIYNRKTHAKYPLLGLKFKNATGLSLMQGPVTVFDGTSYAGDARLPDLQPNEERLVSYAIDLGTEVESQSKVPAAQISTLKIVKGVLHSTRKVREERTYKAVNRSKTDRTLLIEHPYRAEYKLVSTAKPAERTRDLYRFESKIPAGGSASTEVIEERDLEQTIALVSTDENQIRFYIRLPATSPAVKAALEEAISLRAKWSTAQRDLQGVTKQLDEISKDQQRLRANLKELPPTAAAYKRYLEKFDAQETQIEKLQADQKRLLETEQAARTKFEQFLQNLSVE